MSDKCFKAEVPKLRIIDNVLVVRGKIDSSRYAAYHSSLQKFSIVFFFFINRHFSNIIMPDRCSKAEVLKLRILDNVLVGRGKIDSSKIRIILSIEKA